MTPAELVAWLPTIGVNQLLTGDFETYWCKGKQFDKKYHYSVGDMTTEAYIRDPLFKAHMFGYNINQSRKSILVLPSELTDTQAMDQWWVNSLAQFNWQSTALVAHNNFFDGGILGVRYGMHPRLYIDTLTMARALYGADIKKDLNSLAEMLNIGYKGHQLESSNGVRTLSPELTMNLAEYCAGSDVTGKQGDRWFKGDVQLCYELFMHMLPYFTPKHLLIIDYFIRMSTRPLLVGDTEALENYAGVLLAKQDAILLGLGFGSDVDLIRKQLRKADVFAELLLHYGIQPPTKMSRPTAKNPEPKLKYAFSKTDIGMKELLEHDDERISAMAHAKLSLNSTLELSRTERLAAMARRGRMCLPVQWFGAHTSRGSGLDKINPQNIGRASPIRAMLSAPDGWTLVGMDSGQIQARLTAWFAEQLDLVGDFARQDRGELEYADVYCKFASESIYNKPVDKSAECFVERFIGKQSVLGLGFNMGADKFIGTVRTLAFVMLGMTLEIEKPMANSIVQAYRGRYFNIKSIWKELERVLYSMMVGDYSTSAGKHGIIRLCDRGVMLPDDTVIKYTNLHQREKVNQKGEVVLGYDGKPWMEYCFNKSRNGIEATYGGKFLENIIQALEQCIMHDKTIELNAFGYPLILQEHDCLYYMVPVNEADAFEAHSKTVMSRSQDWYHDLPLAADTSIGPTFKEAKP